MSWIQVIDYSEADSNLKRIYNRVKGPNDNIDNVLTIHSLRPHTLTGHMTLYKSVLHNSNNQLPKWYLEALGVYVSYLNKCDYCVSHHLAGLRRLLADDEKTDTFFNAVREDLMDSFFGMHYDLGTRYARKITLALNTLTEADIRTMRDGGFTDGEILEINQVTSYFNYVNRSVVGLGVTTEGDVLGLSPNDSDDPGNWEHT